MTAAPSPESIRLAIEAKKRSTTRRNAKSLFARGYLICLTEQLGVYSIQSPRRWRPRLKIWEPPHWHLVDVIQGICSAHPLDPGRPCCWTELETCKHVIAAQALVFHGKFDIVPGMTEEQMDNLLTMVGDTYATCPCPGSYESEPTDEYEVPDDALPFGKGAGVLMTACPDCRMEWAPVGLLCSACQQAEDDMNFVAETFPAPSHPIPVVPPFPPVFPPIPNAKRVYGECPTCHGAVTADHQEQTCFRCAPTVDDSLQGKALVGRTACYTGERAHFEETVKRIAPIVAASEGVIRARNWTDPKTREMEWA